MSRYCLIALACCVVSVLSSCGTDSDSSVAGVFPTLSYSLPSSVSSAVVLDQGARQSFASNAVVSVEGDELLVNVTARMDRIVRQINAMFERLNNTDGVATTGTFTGKGPAGNVSGKISAISDSTYDFEATICVSSTVFTYARWNEDKTKVEVYRNFGVNPVYTNLTTSMISRIVYDASASTATMQYWAYGAPWANPSWISDTTLTEYVVGSRAESGDHTIKGVSYWDDGTWSTVAGGEGYFTGTLAAAGTGMWAGYRAGATGCMVTPAIATNESTPATWLCRSNYIGGTPTATIGAAGAFYTSHLTAVGVASASNLMKVALPSGVSCQ